MCNWKKWIWPGILATVLLTALAMLMKSADIEQDLTAKANNDLASGHSWAAVELDGRDLKLTGTAPSEAAQAEALQIADDTYDVRVVADASELLPIADPYKLSATKEGGKLVLEGNVPDDAVRAEVVAAAGEAAPGAEIVDNMTLARGAPEGFGALAGFGIAQLTELENGSASLDNTALSVKGAAPSVEIYEGVNNALSGELPGGGSLAMAELSAPVADPYVFSAEKTGEGIVLSGYAPSQSVREAIVKAAEEANPGKAVTDNLELAQGQPEGFEDLAVYGVGQLKGLTSGTASTDNVDLTVKGIAATAETFDGTTNALQGELPGGGKLAMADITPPGISPYTFSAIESENGVVLEGYVPDEETRSRLVASAQKVTPSGNVTDNLKIGSGAPEGFADLVDFGVSQLGQFSSGSVATSDLDLSVRGVALSPKSYDTATSALAGAVPSGGKVVVSDITRSSVSPYTFSASKQEGVIVLDGYVPSANEKSAAVEFAEAQNPGERVIDRLIVANGVPEGVTWPDAVKIAINEASGLSQGKASISNSAYSVEGIAKTNETYDSIRNEANGTLSAGLKLANEVVRRPVIDPYVWSFTNMENGVPTLSGYVPDDGLGSANQEQIVAALGTQKAVTNSLQIGAGTPKGFNSATSVGIRSASRLINGQAEIRGTSLLVSGEALSDFAADEVRSQVENGVPPGFSGKHNITVRKATEVAAVKADTCQELLTDELKHNDIRFETNEAVISEDSFGLLDRLAFVVQRCPTATVEIEGHTDSRGSDEYNQKLSEARANAVRSYLAKAGIFVGRLKAIGYGETKPVADNDTEEGMAQNRRIAFTVVQ